MQRALIRTIRDLFDTSRRQALRFVASPTLALGHMRFRLALLRRDWKGMHAMLRPLAAAARRAHDHRVLTELGFAALRLEEPQLGVALLQEGREGSGRTETTDWRGENISDATLIVRVAESTSQGIGGGMRQVGHIAAAAERAARAVLIVERRMMPLFARTLPNVTVIPFEADIGAFKTGRFVTASTRDLEAVFNHDAEGLAKSFRPIVADQQQARALREKYRGGRDLPLIGISWWSSHYGKDLPRPQQWARLVQGIPAQYVSLQYGDVADDLNFFNSRDPSTVIADADVDQLRDMDTFASQLAALDLVVTISNSGAHLAGALGKRMILIRDDLFRRNWPYLTRSAPWYPNTIVIGKDGRDWHDAFDEVISVARRQVFPSPP
jgi:hypothetical protein